MSESDTPGFGAGEPGNGGSRNGEPRNGEPQERRDGTQRPRPRPAQPQSGVRRHFTLERFLDAVGEAREADAKARIRAGGASLDAAALDADHPDVALLQDIVAVGVDALTQTSETTPAPASGASATASRPRPAAAETGATRSLTELMAQLRADLASGSLRKAAAALEEAKRDDAAAEGAPKADRAQEVDAAAVDAVAANPAPTSVDGAAAADVAQLEALMADAAAGEASDDSLLSALSGGRLAVLFDRRRTAALEAQAAAAHCAPEDVLVTGVDWYLDALERAPAD